MREVYNRFMLSIHPHEKERKKQLIAAWETFLCLLIVVLEC